MPSVKECGKNRQALSSKDAALCAVPKTHETGTPAAWEKLEEDPCGIR